MQLLLVVCLFVTVGFAAVLVEKRSTVTADNVTSNKATAPQRERTFIMIKPMGVQRGFIGEIIGRFEKKGFKLIALKFMKPSKHLLSMHYREIKSRSFFSSYLDYLTSSPVVAMVWEGKDVAEVSRLMIGEHTYAQSLPGTIRGDLGVTRTRNVVHGSDNAEDAVKEIHLWFEDDELMTWDSIFVNLV